MIKLDHLFEPELLEKLKAYPVKSFKNGDLLIEEFCSVEAIPILISGKIEVTQTDYLNRQAHVYDINPIESCILSLVAGQNNQESVGNGIVREDSEIILVPPVVTKQWYDTYSSWREFVSALYNKRLNELIHQRNVVSEQARKIEEQKNEITSSILYARRIQTTVLQTEAAFKRNVPDAFILNRPRDIVSGDFFWSLTMGDTVYFAVADCTGHGVPGAMVSVICSKVLDEVTRLNPEIPLGEILDKVSVRIQEVFKSDEITLSDGMDISLCSFNLKTREFFFSGANNSIYRITALEHHGDSTVHDDKHMVMEYEANRQPVGKTEKNEPFRTYAISYKSGDTVYLTSDGFQDQFGGEKDKKMRKKGMKNYFLEVADLSPEEKLDRLAHFFDEWKGDREQVDDVLLIGVEMK